LALVVPLLSKIISGSKSVVFTSCVLKNEMGRNGIFSTLSTDEGITPIDFTKVWYSSLF
jgi:hypothetical protein